MTFSIMLWMPSWGGMINGLMTLSGAWDKLRTDPVLRMLVVSVAFYGMSTFEGPLMSIKAVNSLSHYTDWTIGHVHSGALGWVGYVSFGALYCLFPWLWNKRELYSLRLVNWHFWVSTIGIVLYVSAMWVSGIMQGLMWRAYTSLGFLEYSFVETVEAMHPYYVIRATRRPAVRPRRADHGLQPVEDRDVRRSSPSARLALRLRLPRKENHRWLIHSTLRRSIWDKHKIFETNVIVLILGCLS
jgi:hypothetical protein